MFLFQKRRKIKRARAEFLTTFPCCANIKEKSSFSLSSEKKKCRSNITGSNKFHQYAWWVLFHICQLFLGGRKPVAFPQKRSVTSEWWTIVYCYILVKENKQNIKERRRPTSWLFSLRDHPLSSRNNFRFHMETKISRHPIDWQYTSRYIFSSSVIRSPFHTKSNF